MSLIKAVIISARPKTLVVSIAVILLGQVLASRDIELYQYADGLDMSIAFLCLLCCCFLQISVNIANDYFDAKSGIDSPARLGPMRASQAGLISSQHLLIAIFSTSLIAVITGLYLILQGGWLFFFLGLILLAGVYTYSGGKKPLASNALGEVAVFLFFGWLGVIASYYLQTQHFNWALFFPASEIGLLIAAVMLVNNIRDISTDSKAGKKTLALHLGPIKSRMVYSLLLLLPFIFIPFNPYMPWLNTTLLPLHLGLCWLIRKRTGKQLNLQLSQTSLLVLLWALGYVFSFLLSPSMPTDFR
jgi:1,4-dihydroxy-2-naphthoate octaprenyltransferase